STASRASSRVSAKPARLQTYSRSLKWNDQPTSANKTPHPIKRSAAHGSCPLHLVFLWRNGSRQRRSAFRQRHQRTALPNTVCQTAGRRTFVVDRQRAVGLLQSHHRLHSHF